MFLLSTHRLHSNWANNCASCSAILLAKPPKKVRTTTFDIVPRNSVWWSLRQPRMNTSTPSNYQVFIKLWDGQMWENQSSNLLLDVVYSALPYQSTHHVTYFYIHKYNSHSSRNNIIYMWWCHTSQNTGFLLVNIPFACYIDSDIEEISDKTRLEATPSNFS